MTFHKGNRSITYQLTSVLVDVAIEIMKTTFPVMGCQ